MLHSDSLSGRSAPPGRSNDAAVARAGYRSTAPRSLELDGSRWRSRRDFYDALTAVLGGIERDCRSSTSLLETMIYHLDLNAERPPYQVVIRDPSDELRPFLRDFAHAVEQARKHRSAKWGDDVEVAVKLA